MLTIKKEKLNEISKPYTLISDKNDMAMACRFTWEVICAEYDAIKERYPNATSLLGDLERTEHLIYDIYRNIQHDIC